MPRSTASRPSIGSEVSSSRSDRRRDEEAPSSYATDYTHGPTDAPAPPSHLERNESLADQLPSSKRKKRRDDSGELNRALDDDDGSGNARRRDSEKRRRDSKRSDRARRDSTRAIDEQNPSLVQNQFPGEFPTTYAEPYRPPGLASEYYGDHGESVQHQPGVRPQPPSVIHTADQAHLQEATIEANPPAEPSSLGQVGAAASFFANSGDNEVTTNSIPSQPGRRPSLRNQSQSQPNVGASPRSSPGPVGRRRTTTAGGAVGNIAPIAKAAGVGLAAEYYSGNIQITSPDDPPPTNANQQSYQQYQSHQQSQGGQQSHNYQQNEGVYSKIQTSSRPSKPPATPPSNSNMPMYGAAAVAGLASAAVASHYHNTSHSEQQQVPHSQNGSSINAGLGQPAFPATQQRHKHKRRGPLTRVVDWFRDPEAVAEFEMYTEQIGVCKYCFDPNSSPMDAPRKHHYRSRRRSSGSRYGSSTRVDKMYRYSSDEERRKRSTMKKAALGGIAALGAAKIGETIYNQRNDFDDTYSVKSGRPANASRVSFKDDEERYSVRKKRYSGSSEDLNASHGGSRRSSRMDGQVYEKRSSRRRDSSVSETDLRGDALSSGIAAAGIATASGRRRRRSRSKSPTKKKNYYSKRISPRHSYVDLSATNSGPLGFGGFFSSPSANKRNGKKSKGFFNFTNASSSSSDADLAFGQGTVRRKARQRQEKEDEGDATTAILGLAATGAALAAASDRKESKAKRKSKAAEMAGRDSRTTPGRSSSIALRDSEASDAMNDGAWEDASDDESSNHSALAYGAAASVFSASAKHSPAIAGSSNQPPLRRLEPVATSDPTVFDVREPSVVSGVSSRSSVLPFTTVSKSEAVPLQQPQPVTPIAPSLYETPQYSSQPTGTPVFDRGAQSSPLTESPKQLSAGRRESLADAERKDRRRRDSSPVALAARESRESVQFDLTEEQLEQEKRRERRRRRREERERRNAEEAAVPNATAAIESELGPNKVEPGIARTESTSADVRASREAEIERELQRLYEEDRQQNEERGRNSATIGVAAAAAAAAVGGAAVVIAGQSYDPTADEEKRREEKPFERRSSMKKNKERDVTVAESPQERIARVAARRVRSTPSPVYEDYSTFFVPPELAKNLPEHNFQSEHRDDALAEEAHFVEIVPASVSKRKEVFDEFLYRPFGTEPDDDPSIFSWPVPQLELVEPTPPSSRPQSVIDERSPIIRPESPEEEPVVEEIVPGKKARRSSVGSRVTWGDQDTYVYEVQTPEWERGEFGTEHELENGTKFHDEVNAATIEGLKEIPPVEEMTKDQRQHVAMGKDFSELPPSREEVEQTRSTIEDDPHTSPVIEKSVPSSAQEQNSDHDYSFVATPTSEGGRSFYQSPFTDMLPTPGDIEHVSTVPARGIGFVEDLPTPQVGGTESTSAAMDDMTPVAAGGFNVLDYLKDGSSDSIPTASVLAASALGAKAAAAKARQRSERASEVSTRSQEDKVASGGFFDNPFTPSNADVSTRSKNPKSSSKDGKPRRRSLDKDVVDDQQSKGSHHSRSESQSSVQNPQREESVQDDGFVSSEEARTRNAKPQLPEEDESFLAMRPEMPLSTPTATPMGTDGASGLRFVRSDREAATQNPNAFDDHELQSFSTQNEQMPSSSLRQDFSSIVASAALKAKGRTSTAVAEPRLPGDFAEVTQVPSTELRRDFSSIATSAALVAQGWTKTLSPVRASPPMIQETSIHPDVSSADESTRPRRLSNLRTDDVAMIPVVASSPTAVPVNSRRFPVSPANVRKASFGSAASPGSPSTTTRTRQGRPPSTEFRSVREFRPLYLVERHSSAKQPPPEVEETFPSLPSSRTTSAQPSMENLRGDDTYDYFGGQDRAITPEEMRRQSYSYWHDEGDRSPDFLDSGQATPTATSPGLARKEKPKYEFHSPSELLQEPLVDQDILTEHDDQAPLASPLPSVVSTDRDEHMSARSQSRSVSPGHQARQSSRTDGGDDMWKTDAAGVLGGAALYGGVEALRSGSQSPSRSRHQDMDDGLEPGEEATLPSHPVQRHASAERVSPQVSSEMEKEVPERSSEAAVAAAKRAIEAADAELNASNRSQLESASLKKSKKDKKKDKRGKRLDSLPLLATGNTAVRELSDERHIANDDGDAPLTAVQPEEAVNEVLPDELNEQRRQLEQQAAESGDFGQLESSGSPSFGVAEKAQEESYVPTLDAAPENDPTAFQEAFERAHRARGLGSDATRDDALKGFLPNRNRALEAASELEPDLAGEMGGKKEKKSKKSKKEKKESTMRDLVADAGEKEESKPAIETSEMIGPGLGIEAAATAAAVLTTHKNPFGDDFEIGADGTAKRLGAETTLPGPPASSAQDNSSFGGDSKDKEIPASTQDVQINEPFSAAGAGEYSGAVQEMEMADQPDEDLAWGSTSKKDKKKKRKSQISALISEISTPTSEDVPDFAETPKEEGDDFAPIKMNVKKGKKNKKKNTISNWDELASSASVPLAEQDDSLAEPEYTAAVSKEFQRNIEEPTVQTVADASIVDDPEQLPGPIESASVDADNQSFPSAKKGKKSKRASKVSNPDEPSGAFATEDPDPDTFAQSNPTAEPRDLTFGDVGARLPTNPTLSETDAGREPLDMNEDAPQSPKEAPEAVEGPSSAKKTKKGKKKNKVFDWEETPDVFSPNMPAESAAESARDMPLVIDEQDQPEDLSWANLKPSKKDRKKRGKSGTRAELEPEYAAEHDSEIGAEQEDAEIQPSGEPESTIGPPLEVTPVSELLVDSRATEFEHDSEQKNWLAEASTSAAPFPYDSARQVARESVARHETGNVDTYAHDGNHLEWLDQAHRDAKSFPDRHGPQEEQTSMPQGEDAQDLVKLRLEELQSAEDTTHQETTKAAVVEDPRNVFAEDTIPQTPSAQEAEVLQSEAADDLSRATGKKSKPEKKKGKKSRSSTLDEFSEPSTPLETALEAGFDRPSTASAKANIAPEVAPGPPADASSAIAPVMSDSTPFESAQQEQQDFSWESTPSKKNKKDKKKKKSLAWADEQAETGTSTPLSRDMVEIAPKDVSAPEVSSGDLPTTSATEEAIYADAWSAEPEQEIDYPIPGSFALADQEEDSQAEISREVKHVESAEPPEDSPWATPSKKKDKKEKKDKKKRSSRSQDEEGVESPAPAEEPSAPVTPAVEEEEEWGFSSKKSRKDKKKRASTIMDEDVADPSTPAEDFSVPATPAAEEDEWDFTTKKGKKGKKRISNLQDDDATASATPDYYQSSGPANPAPEQTDEWDFAPTESKKGKKKKKSLLAYDEVDTAFSKDDNEGDRSMDAASAQVERHMSANVEPESEYVPANEFIDSLDMQDIAPPNFRSIQTRAPHDHPNENPFLETAEGPREGYGVIKDTVDPAVRAQHEPQRGPMGTAQPLGLDDETFVPALEPASTTGPHHTPGVSEYRQELNTTDPEADDWAFTTKKSKKDKNKTLASIRGEHDVVPEALAAALVAGGASAAFANDGDDEVSREISDTASRPEVSAAETRAESAGPAVGKEVDTAVDDEWGYSTKKAKKDKKKRQSTADASAAADYGVEERMTALDQDGFKQFDEREASRDTVEPIVDYRSTIPVTDGAPEADIDRTISVPAEDEWAIPFTKSKKDKKRKSQSTVDATRSSRPDINALLVDAEVKARPMDDEVDALIAEVEARDVPKYDDAVEDDAAMSNADDRDKKMQDLPSNNSPLQVHSSVEADQGVDPVDDTWGFSTKKSKKDKKKKRHSIPGDFTEDPQSTTPAEDTRRVLDEFEPQDVVDAEKDVALIAPGEAFAAQLVGKRRAQEDPGLEEWTIGTKISKKDKKKKRQSNYDELEGESHPITPAEEPADISVYRADEAGIDEDTPVLPEARDAGSANPVEASAMNVPTEEDLWSTGKKGKKDKKKKRQSTLDDIGTTEAQPTAVLDKPIETPVEASLESEAFDESTKGADPLDIATYDDRQFDLEPSIAEEAPVTFSSKKSKKDKKKKKSLFSWDAAEDESGEILAPVSGLELDFARTHEADSRAWGQETMEATTFEAAEHKDLEAGRMRDPSIGVDPDGTVNEEPDASKGLRESQAFDTENERSFVEDHGEPEISRDIKEEPVQIAETEAFGVARKKSKKGKKARATDYAVEDATETTRQAEPLAEESVRQPAEAKDDDDWAFTNLKSKKSKREKRDKRLTALAAEQDEVEHVTVPASFDDVNIAEVGSRAVDMGSYEYSEQRPTSPQSQPSSSRERRRRRSPAVWDGEEPADLPTTRSKAPAAGNDDFMDTALSVATGLGLAGAATGAASHRQSEQTRQEATRGVHDSEMVQRQHTDAPGWSFANLAAIKTAADEVETRDSGVQFADSPTVPRDHSQSIRDSGYVASPVTRSSWREFGGGQSDRDAASARRRRPQSPTSSAEDLRGVRHGSGHRDLSSEARPDYARDMLATPERGQPLPVGIVQTKHLPTASGDIHRSPSIHGHNGSREALRASSPRDGTRSMHEHLSEPRLPVTGQPIQDQHHKPPKPEHSRGSLGEPLSPPGTPLQTIHEDAPHLGSSKREQRDLSDIGAPEAGINSTHHGDSSHGSGKTAALAGLAGVGAVAAGGAARIDSRDAPASSRTKTLGRTQSRTHSSRQLRSPYDPSNFASSSSQDLTDVKGKGAARGMADVYDGYGEHPSSPRSPTRPPSVGKRQSMQQMRDLETRVEQLANENRSLAEAKIAAERHLEDFSHERSQSDFATQDALQAVNVQLRDKDEDILNLRQGLDTLQSEVVRLTEVNKELTIAHATIHETHEQRYSQLQDQHDETQTQFEESSRELDDLKAQHKELSTGMEEIVRHQIRTELAEKDAEIERLYEELEVAKEQIKELQQQILTTSDVDEVVTMRDEDYFDNACQTLCQHVQQWVLRFSKFSDTRVCRSTNEVRDEKVVDRFDNAILDGSDVDIYLADRVKRRDVFMSVVMTMIWEYVFTRYLFGMDREQRQRLKQLEKQLGEVGPSTAVHQWRAMTLTLLSRREAFGAQRESDTEAVSIEILTTLSRFLPPPRNLDEQIKESLQNVMRAAVDLSIEMRTQRAEYIMLPPLQPEYDTNGDLARKVYFNASLMNERSGQTTSNDELEQEEAVVRMVLFPLVVKKGDDRGDGEEEIVVCPAQVLVAREDVKGKGRRVTSGMADRMSVDQRAASRMSLKSQNSRAPSTVDVSIDMGNMI